MTLKVNNIHLKQVFIIKNWSMNNMTKMHYNAWPHFTRLASNFPRLKGILFKSPWCDCIKSILQMYIWSGLCHVDRVRRLFSSRRRMTKADQWTIDTGGSTIYWPVWTTPCASMANLTCVIFHCERLLIGIVTAFANAVACCSITLSA